MSTGRIVIFDKRAYRISERAYLTALRAIIDKDPNSLTIAVIAGGRFLGEVVDLDQTWPSAAEELLAKNSS